MKPDKKAPAKVKPVQNKVKPSVIADQDNNDLVAPTKEKLKTAPKQTKEKNTIKNSNQREKSV